MTGEIMSPVISIRSAMEPIQSFSSESIDGGITSAMSLPRRVTRRGVFVLFTSSSNDKHFALNSEIAISRIGFFPRLGIAGLLRTVSVYHGHLEWSDILHLGGNQCQRAMPITDRQACRNVSVRAGERRSVQRISEHRGGASTGDGCASTFPDVDTISLIYVLSYYQKFPSV